MKLQRSRRRPERSPAKRRWIERSALVLIAAGVGQPLALAAGEPSRFEITPLLGYRVGGTFEIEGSDGAYEIVDSRSHGLILNLRESGNTQWELLYSRQTSAAEPGAGAISLARADLDLEVLQIGGTYQGAGETLRPYLAATLGGTRIDTGDDSDTFFSMSLGLGLQLRPAARLGLRIEGRAHGTLTKSDTDLFCSLGGDPSVCAVRVKGDLVGQFEVFAGIVLRF